MARWITPETQRLKSNVAWALVIAWGALGFLAWTRFGWSFLPIDTQTPYGQLALGIGVLLLGLCLSILLAGKLIRLVFGWRYQPLDSDRVNVAMQVDQQRISKADRRA